MSLIRLRVRVSVRSKQARASACLRPDAVCLPPAPTSPLTSEAFNCNSRSQSTTAPDTSTHDMHMSHEPKHLRQPLSICPHDTQAIPTGMVSEGGNSSRTRTTVHRPRKIRDTTSIRLRTSRVSINSSIFSRRKTTCRLATLCLNPRCITTRKNHHSPSCNQMRRRKSECSMGSIPTGSGGGQPPRPSSQAAVKAAG